MYASSRATATAAIICVKTTADHHNQGRHPSTRRRHFLSKWHPFSPGYSNCRLQYLSSLRHRMQKLCHSSPNNADFAQPPRNTALVTEVLSTEQPRTLLVPESELKLCDREIMIGDVVKRDPRDPMSGTVVAVDVNAYLFPPISWSETPTWTNPPPRSWDLTQLVGPVSAADLAWPPHIEVSDIIVYKNQWVGRVVDCWQEVTIRLSNGSVVVPEHEDDVAPIYSDLACEVGDRVKTKKSNLRRGRWIFGSYDPNIEPVGVVLNLETTSVAVDWLASNSDTQNSESPDSELGRDTLQSGDVHLYDPQRTPPGFGSALSSSEGRDRCRLDVNICDIVKFHNLQMACDYYNKDNRLASGSGTAALRCIPRQQTLGYDTNWFMVARKETTLRVRWQDLSESIVPARDVVPTLDLDDDEDVWPGEIVCTRASKDDDRTTYSPRRVGVAQAVDAKDRIATVKWFEGTVSFPADDKSVLLPGSWTGDLEDGSEDCSLYEIWAVPALTRRPGDFVVLSKFHRVLLEDEQVAVRSKYHELERLLDEQSSNCNFFGEIVSLGADGMVQVRLGALAEVRDFSVPAECLNVVQMGDWDQDLMDEEGDESEAFAQAAALLAQEGGEIPRYLQQVADIVASVGQPAPWLDENNEPVDENFDDEWEDDGETSVGSTAEGHSSTEPAENASDVPQPIPVPAHQHSNLSADSQSTAQSHGLTSSKSAAGTSSTGGPKNSPDAVLLKESLPSDHVSLVGSRFTYATMLEGLALEDRPEPMSILEGAAPADHHFYSSGSVRGPSASVLRRIQKEIAMLQSGLPEGVFVRTWEQAIHLFRFMFVGPLDTPYEYVPIVIDIELHSGWPNEPPKTFFHSWTDGSAPINPNLYEDGKICLSLLGTWPGEEQQQGWMPTSTILQLVVSILGLVLVKEPYFNEAGFEVRAGAIEARIPSALYSERTYFRSRSFIKHALDFPIGGFEEVINALYRPGERGPNLLIRAIWSATVVLHRSSRASEQSQTPTEGRTVSRGALMPLRRQILALLSPNYIDQDARVALVMWLAGGPEPTGGPGGVFTELAETTETAATCTTTH